MADASKIDEQEQTLRRITSILAERPEKTLDHLDSMVLLLRAARQRTALPLVPVETEGLSAVLGL